MKKNYNLTIISAFIGYVVQAVVNNFVPLLFVTFQASYGLSLSEVTSLITINFSVQIIVDIIGSKLVDKIGYRGTMLISNAFAIAGFIMLTFLPEVMPNAFVGILLSVMVYAVGGGLLEVVVSPLVEACPTKNKEAAMSLLHSFYCWGHAAVIVLSALFFRFVGISHWKILAYLWCLVPLVDLVLFCFVPVASLEETISEKMSLGSIFKNKFFWILFVMMLCAGASEQAVSQWTSAFVEVGLGISKENSDLLGPLIFALLMGTSRALYGKFGDKISLNRFMYLSLGLCVISYLLISFSPFAWLSLVGVGLCGFSVGILWPATFSKGAKLLKNGGTTVFALLALAGDLGCDGGPTLVGQISNLFSGKIQYGIAFGLVFPLTLIVLLTLLGRNETKGKESLL